MPRIVLTSRIAAPAQECFDLSVSVDAHTASMADSGERIVGGVTSGAMGLGDTVTWRARHFGIAFTMTSRISTYERPLRFVDEQVSGPFARWWHEHRFDEHDGVTTMTDTVELRSPYGPLGRVVDRLFLTGYMTRLLEQRNAWLAETLASGAETPAGDVEIALVDERDSSWEDPHPRFRVYLHGSGATSTTGSTATYDIVGADVLQVIDWAQRRAGTTLTYAIALVRDEAREERDPAHGRGLVWLVGMDGNDVVTGPREAATQDRMLARRASPVGVPARDRMPRPRREG